MVITVKGSSSLRFIVCVLLVIAMFFGCSKDDSVTKAEKKDAEKPGIAEVKSIAEEGFIYGLPIVMFYGALYENAIDRNSGQFKAPLNEIYNIRRSATPEDTSVITPNADTPYSLAFMDLRAEPMVISVPAVEKSRYYVVQLADGNIFNYGYMGSRSTGNDAGDYLVTGPDWKGEKPTGVKQVFQSSTQFSLPPAF